MVTQAAGTPYFEAEDRRQNQLDEMMARSWGRVAPRVTSPLMFRRLGQLADAVEAVGRDLRDLSDRHLVAHAQSLRGRLLREGMALGPAAAAFALTREACTRQIGLRHHRVQLIGGGAMLGRTLAEMETGEGKTITALLPSVAFALSGRPVHVVTVNDYLAERDAEQLRPVYNALGLSVGLVVQGQSPEQRRAAYACDVTYCTNKDLVFDYLRDRLALGTRRARSRLLVDEVLSGRSGDRLLLRGLHVAIVDEADSVLIDEARTPLILSGSDGGEEDAAVYEAALDIARQLRAGEDYELRPQDRDLTLTPRGRLALQRLAGGRGGLWAARRAREELAERALSALHYYRRDEQYIVVDGKVQIVDEFTGRVMPDRAWEHGLHQMVEAKEGCAVTGRRLTLARITYQRFFRRYEHLCGMTGTAAEVKGEMRAVYDLGVLRIPTHHRLLRRDAGVRVFADAERKWAAVAESARVAMTAGRSVLIGTRSVEASEHVGRVLQAAGMTPLLLNARQDKQEADVVAAAGQPGRITVATNMAGRGTDIRLARAVREAGGLHVILTEFHESARIDRQLFGRGGRQGDPGSFESIAALDDELFRRFLVPAWRWLAARLVLPGELPLRLAHRFVRRAQQRAERNNARTRRETLANDVNLDRMLGFAGKGE
ncbi:MAG: DEAD/DEAH box helicase [Acetobacteraceae bacterium]